MLVTAIWPMGFNCSLVLFSSAFRFWFQIIFQIILASLVPGLMKKKKKQRKIYTYACVRMTPYIYMIRITTGSVCRTVAPSPGGTPARQRYHHHCCPRIRTMRLAKQGRRRGSISFIFTHPPEEKSRHGLSIVVCFQIYHTWYTR